MINLLNLKCVHTEMYVFCHWKYYMIKLESSKISILKHIWTGGFSIPLFLAVSSKQRVLPPPPPPPPHHSEYKIGSP